VQSDIDVAIRASRQIEDLLEQRLGATGRGLHEKVTSVEGRLPPPLVKRLRWIASVRNAVVHDHDGTIRDRAAFDRAVEEAVANLNAEKTDYVGKMQSSDSRKGMKRSGTRQPERPVRRARAIGAAGLALGLGMLLVLVLALLSPEVLSGEGFLSPGKEDPKPVVSGRLPYIK
jgi:hypothetical protein